MLLRWTCAPLLVLAVLAASVLAWLLVPAPHLLEWLDESGPIEALTVQLYLVAALAAVLRLNGAGLRATGNAVALILLACAARELDWHFAFTGTSILRVSYYFGSAPAMHKLLSFLAVGLVIVAIVALLRLHLRGLWAGVRALSPPSVTVVTLLAALASTKILDRSVNLLELMSGVRESPAVRALQLALEEPLELALPLLVLVALLQFRPQQAGAYNAAPPRLAAEPAPPASLVAVSLAEAVGLELTEPAKPRSQ